MLKERMIDQKVRNLIDKWAVIINKEMKKQNLDLEYLSLTTGINYDRLKKVLRDGEIPTLKELLAISEHVNLDVLIQLRRIK